MLCYVMILCHVISCYGITCHAMSCYIMQCHVMLCHVILCCHVMLCHVILCCHVMLCHVKSCHVASYCVMLSNYAADLSAECVAVAVDQLDDNRPQTIAEDRVLASTGKEKLKTIERPVVVGSVAHARPERKVTRIQDDYNGFTVNHA